ATATNPFPCRTYVPFRTMLQKRHSSGCDGTDALRLDRDGTNVDELTDGCVDEERRVVVAVAAPGPVDEHRVVRAELAAPAPALQLGRERAQPCAALLLDGGRHGVVGGRRRAGTRRVRKHVDVREAR